MFGFLKELVAAAKEGVDEAHAEQAQQEVTERDDRRRRADELADQVAAASPESVFAVALGAVYRLVFLSEFERADTESRPPAYLYLAALPGNEVKAVTKLLRRDFDVADAAGAVASAVELERNLGPIGAEDYDADTDAVLIARGSWLVTAAAGAGLLAPDSVLELTRPFVRRAALSYGSWAEFGQRFLAGERWYPGSNPLGRRSLALAVDALMRTPGSPWQDVRWPTDRDPAG